MANNLFHLGTTIISKDKPIKTKEKLYNSDDAIKINLSDEDRAELLITNSIDALTKEKIIKEIIGEKLLPNNGNSIKCNTKPKSLSKSKVGYLKEGYYNIYGINPIDRYNFVIDRYNEDINRDNEPFLRRVPSFKILRRLYDLYTWICRVIFGVFLVIAYYLYSFKYNKNKNRDHNNNLNNSSNQSRANRRRVITYKLYLFDENQDYFNRNSDSPRCYLIVLGVLFLIFSFYMALVFFLVMLIPNVFFTIYLCISLIIHWKNIRRQPDIFKSMIYESKLDEKAQLNDYIIVDSKTLKYYDGFSFYEKLSKLHYYKESQNPQSFMLYGDLFANEYNILISSFYKQIIGILGFIGFGYMFYL